MFSVETTHCYVPPKALGNAVLIYCTVKIKDKPLYKLFINSLQVVIHKRFIDQQNSEVCFQRSPKTFS